MEEKKLNKVTYLTPGQKVCPVCGGTHIQNVSRITVITTTNIKKSTLSNFISY